LSFVADQLCGVVCERCALAGLWGEGFARGDPVVRREEPTVWGAGSYQHAGALMEKALRNRLTFGPIMIAALLGLLWLDHVAEGWTTGRGTETADHIRYGIGGIGLLVLLIIILQPAVVELTQLFAAE